MSENFKAVVLNKIEDQLSIDITNLNLNDLPDSDVLVRVNYSGVNYKDGLAATPDGHVVSSFPIVPGIDLAGTVVSSKDGQYKPGDQVIVTSYGLGVNHYGGYSEYACVPNEWIVPLPEQLTLKEAMILGTAGFTAALSIHRLEQNGLTPDKGKVLVTGATGGVGSLAVAMLAKLGYYVVASTGKESEHDYLYELGAKEIVSREVVCSDKLSALDKQSWAGAVDPVGGKTLAAITSKLQYGGSVAVSGLTGGSNVPTTVYPFILRGVNVLGIDSVQCPMDVRLAIWARLATDLKISNLPCVINQEIGLEEIPVAVECILQGNVRGRYLIKL